jgi:tetratricopeptide (TPR) repeat protein
VVTKILISLFVLSISATAFAQDDQGRQAFEQASTYFDLGEYDAALPYYLKAYEQSGHRPSTIRALAQCERALKMYDEAILHFQEYLSTGPEEAPQIEETIKLLKQLQAEKRAMAKPQPEPDPNPALTPAAEENLSQGTGEEDSSIIESPVLWVIVGAVAVVAGGVALGVALSGTEEPYGGTRMEVLTR